MTMPNESDDARVMAYCEAATVSLCEGATIHVDVLDDLPAYVRAVKVLRHALRLAVALDSQMAYYIAAAIRDLSQGGEG